VFVIAFLLMRAASVLVRVNKLWIEPDSLIIVSDGSVEIALGVIRQAAVVVRGCVFRVKPDGLTIVGNSTTIVALPVVCIAAIVVRGRSFRIEPDSLIVVSDGVFVVALFAVCVAAVVVGGSYEPDSTRDQTIAGCTALILSGRESKDHLALEFYNRAYAHHAMGNYDYAIADYDQATRLNPKDAPGPILVLLRKRREFCHR
jgi:tetratricopeptide (TPR) repeat protein